MKTVCICGSFRHYDEMLAFRAALLERGVSCEWPVSGLRRDPKTMTRDEAGIAIRDHLAKMDRADAIVIFNKDGYLGRSVVMEVGYACARGKPMYAIEPVDDEFLSSLVTAILKPDELVRLLGE